MSFLNSIDVSASGLTAQRLRMDTIASNMANVETTRVANGQGPYRRHVVVFEAQDNQPKGKFKSALQDQLLALSGVKVKEIRQLGEDEAPFRKVYEPSNPDADAQGYVNYPNVNVVEEMINMISATRAFEANSKVIEASRAMAMRALDIGR
ncbi:MAG: flagellar basal body rod protein FlgC [Firmicutes bacterium HGW-Firmicutes-15]|nr:MAG: flagellar basal body rod protein FlgC [Firmicutes bacterium HGW-Firmicutes-15]